MSRSTRWRWPACVALALSAFLIAVPEIMFANGTTNLTERLFPLIAIAVAWSDVSLAALAYRHNVGATVTARAVVEPWMISIAALAFSLYDHAQRPDPGLYRVDGRRAGRVADPVLSHLRRPGRLATAAGAVAAADAQSNAPLAGADALEWGTRNADRYMLGLMFEPKVVGLYYMAQQVASLPQKLKTSFDPVLGPVITQSLAENDRARVAAQVRQVGFWIIAAQTGLAVMGSMPNESVMNLIGPQFIGGAAALTFLLFAEVAASTGAVCESALVYVARHRNLMISIAMLAFQIGFSLVLIWAIRRAGFPIVWQAAGPAIALMLSLGADVGDEGAVAGAAAGGAGVADPLAAGDRRGSSPPARARSSRCCRRGSKLVEVLVELPVIAIVYFWLLWRWVFGDEDRALFQEAAAACRRRSALPARRTRRRCISAGSGGCR